MQFSSYIPILLLIVIIIYIQNNQRVVITKKILNKRKSEELSEMIELAKRFIGKECLIYSFSNQQFCGVITEISDSAILIEKNGQSEAVNLEFIVRIREYPRNKKGKKKSVVVD